RQQPARELELWTFEPAYPELAPLMRAQLPRTIRYYDPENSNYVIIAPRAEFYALDFVKRKAAEGLDKYKRLGGEVLPESAKNRIRGPWIPASNPALDPKKYLYLTLFAAALAGSLAVTAGAIVTAVPAATAVTAEVSATEALLAEGGT